MRKMRGLMCVIVILALTVILAGCSRKVASDENIQCGIMNWQEPSDLEIFPHPALGEWKQYSSLTSMILDLNARNIEYILVPTSVASYLKAQDD